MVPAVEINKPFRIIVAHKSLYYAKNNTMGADFHNLADLAVKAGCGLL